MKKILIFSILLLLLSFKTFGTTRFAIGGAVSMTSNSTDVGVSAGMSLGFYAGNVPLIWDILLGSATKIGITTAITPFIFKTRFDWHIMNWQVSKNVVVFFGPGFGLETITYATQSPTITILTISSIAALRIPVGLKIFPTKQVEVFIQFVPEIGITLDINQYIQGASTSNLPPIPRLHWAFDTSLGLRFWV